MYKSEKSWAGTRDVTHGVGVRREDGVLLARINHIARRARQQRCVLTTLFAGGIATSLPTRLAHVEICGSGCIDFAAARKAWQQRRPPQRLCHFLRRDGRGPNQPGGPGDIVNWDILFYDTFTGGLGQLV